jgi:hypothetical protein
VGLHQVLGELSRGGMGVVYKARHVVLDRVVALKMMRADARLWPEEGQRFEREMRAVARLRHPHILPIYEIGWHEGQPFYTMPYIAGGSLTGQRPRLQGEPRAALLLIAKVARAVQHAHEQGIVHRDLKPGNVLLDEGGEPLVADFGLAKVQDDVELTQTGAVLGTAPYMAPEQAAGRTRQVGPWTDVWSLGVMLYELLTGQRPFIGDSNEEIKDRILRTAPRRPRALEAKLDKGVECIILKCLRKDPARRYASAGELADDLDRHLLGQRPQVCNESWYRRLQGSVGARRPRRRMALLLGTALLLVAAGFLLAPTRFWTWHASDLPGSAPPPPIVLFDASTAPELSHWVNGARAGEVLAMPPERPLTIRSKQHALMQLYDSPLFHPYRLEAEVELQDEGQGGEAGIYFALDRHQAPPGGYFAFCRLRFSESGQDPGLVDLCPMRLQDSAPFAADELPLGGTRPTFSPSRKGAPVRRKLALEVDEAEVRAFWGDMLIRQAPRKQLEERSQRLFAGIRGVVGRYNPQGGLGIFVCEGTATFYRMILQPLP